MKSSYSDSDSDSYNVKNNVKKSIASGKRFRRLFCLFAVMLLLVVAVVIPMSACDDTEYRTFIVSFDAGDIDEGVTVSNLPDSQEVTEGEHATEPETIPTAAGWTFQWWYKYDEYKDVETGAYDFSTAITADVTIHAHWTKDDTADDSADDSADDAADDSAD